MPLSLETRIALFVVSILLTVPLLQALMGEDLPYTLNVAFYTQKIYLIFSLFIFVSFLVLKEDLKKIGCGMVDIDDAIVYGVICIFLFVLLALLHVNFDTLMKLGIMDAHKGYATLGAGWILADTIELDGIELDSLGIKKIMVLENETNASTSLRLHGGWIDPDGLRSRIFMKVNEGEELEITEKFVPLKNNEPGWMTVTIPKGVLKKGNNNITIKSFGNSYVFVSSQWVYHDAKTLGFDGKYYGQEALIYLEGKPVVSTLFRGLYGIVLPTRMLAMAFLLLVFFRADFLKAVASRYGPVLLIAGISSIAAINTIYFIQNQWLYLSVIISKLLSGIVGLFYNPYLNLGNPQGPIIGLNGFYMAVYKNCSGIESISVFLMLFLTSVFFHWKAINKIAIPFLFAAGIMGTLTLNIIRLGTLLLTGAFISRELASHAFHSNLGWILALGYFAVFNEIVTRFFCKRRGGTSA